MESKRRMKDSGIDRFVRVAALATLAAVLAALVSGVLWLYARSRRETAGEKVVIAVPYSEQVQDYGTNYYTRWLEDATGYDIHFVYLDEGYERESLASMLTSDNSNVDAVFFPQGQDVLSYGEYQDYIEKGYLCAPQEFLAADSNLAGLEGSYPDADFDGLLGADGKFYCFPSLNMSRTGKNRQILWINMDWLTRLHLTVPRTTEEFWETLEAFAGGDPNGNGLADELPMVSCEADDALSSYRYLLNAFAYYDGMSLPWDEKEGAEAVREKKAFRAGISYCANAYQRGFLAGDGFSYTKKQLMELVNDPADMVGAFASHSIADVIYANNPDVLAHFVQLAPLSSDYLAQGYAVSTDILPDIGGVIPANAPHREAAAEIMDAMLSNEAVPIALYGEEDVDWYRSRDGELSTYGTRAKITTIHYLKGERQNKHYAGAGPLLATADYTDGVTWNGNHSMMEYIDARAVKAYEAYYHPAAEEMRISRETAAEYLTAEILRFVTGERDVEDDGDWEAFLAGYKRLVES